MTKRIAIYTRVSKDRLGDERSPIRQEADCRSFAAIRDWTVEATYRDVDLSAYQPRVKRPGYEALLEAITERRIDGVLVWKLDRLVRRSAEFERFWASCEQADVSLASVTEPIDTSNELGLAIVRILVTFAALESTTKSLRLKSAYRAAAFAGDRPMAPQRPYGLVADWSTIVPEEAAVIREAAARVLHGESTGSIVRDLADRNVRGARGARWTNSGLRDVLCNPRIAGLRTYQGEIVAKGSWPAIIDELTLARLRLHFADPTRRRSESYGRNPYLLTGFIRCGNCGSRLTVRTWGTKHPGERSYTCQPKPRGCCGVAIRCHLLDGLVSAEALDRIEHLRSRALAWERRAQATNLTLASELERQRTDLTRAADDYYVQHLIDREQFLAIRDRLQHKFAHSQERLLPLRVRELLNLFGRRGVRAVWQELHVSQRREVLATVLDHVVVHRGPTTGRFHPERVEIFWFGQGPVVASASRFVPPPKRRRDRPGATFNAKQAAACLGLNIQYVLRLIKRGDIEGTRLGHEWRVTQQSIDEFLQRRRVRPKLVAPAASESAFARASRDGKD
jgi:site-specific DNA recombinase